MRKRNRTKILQKITPFLWFDNQAEEAANFYASIFKKSNIVKFAHHGEAYAEVSGRPRGIGEEMV